MRSPASRTLSGGRPTALSRSSSTATPPEPKLMAGPNAGSVITPIMSSRPSRRVTIDCTRTPVTFASGRMRWTVAMMSSNW